MKRYEKLSKEDILGLFNNANKTGCDVEACKVSEFCHKQTLDSGAFCENDKLQDCKDVVYNYLMEELPEIKEVFRWEAISSEWTLDIMHDAWLVLVREADRKGITPPTFGQYLREKEEIPSDTRLISRKDILEEHISKSPRIYSYSREELIDLFKGADESCKNCIVIKSVLKNNPKLREDNPEWTSCNLSDICEDATDEWLTCNELIGKALKEEAEFVPRWCTITDNNDLISMEVQYDSKGERKGSFLHFLKEYIEI